MAHTGGTAECSAESISDSRWLRYRAEYETARIEAAVAGAELQRLIACIAPPHVVGEAARKAHLSAARLYTAAACLLSPP